MLATPKVLSFGRLKQFNEIAINGSISASSKLRMEKLCAGVRKFGFVSMPIHAINRFMELYPSSSEIPKKARVRGPWIVFRLRVVNTSLAAIAAELEVTKAAISDAITNGSSERLERVVAEKLHLPVQTLFPERYDAAGCRLRPKRKRTTPLTPRNVKGREAA